MKFKNFVKPTLQKIILLIFVFLFVPTFFYLYVVVGFVPLVGMLSFKPGFFSLLSFLLVLIYLLIYYFIICIFVWAINKIPYRNLQWVIIILICVIFVSISFIEGIYSVRDAGGGIQEYNLPKLLKLDDTSIFCKEKCGKIMFSEDNYPFLTEKGSTIYTLQCVCKDGRTMNFDKDSLEKIWDSRES